MALIPWVIISKWKERPLWSLLRLLHAFRSIIVLLGVLLLLGWVDGAAAAMDGAAVGVDADMVYQELLYVPDNPALVSYSCFFSLLYSYSPEAFDVKNLQVLRIN